MNRPPCTASIYVVQWTLGGVTGIAVYDDAVEMVRCVVALRKARASQVTSWEM